MIETPTGYRDLLRAATNAAGTPLSDRSVPTVFVHVPKTAGSAFTRFLVAGFERPFEITWDDLDARLDAFRTACAKHDGPDLAYGHVLWSHLERLAADPRPYRLITFLRDPVDRAISHYRYCCSPSHPPHEQFKTNFPTLDRYIERGKKMWADHMANELVGGATSVDEFVAKANARYAFVGVTELYDLSLYVFCAAFGLAFEPARRRVNAASDRAPDGVVVTDAHREALAAENAVDQGFYDHVVAEYRAHAPAWFTRLAHEAIPEQRGWRRLLGR